MKHHFLDHYWTIESSIHRLDPRVKIFLSLFALLAVVATPNGRYLDFILFLPIIVFSYHLSKLPLGCLLRRLLIILPIVTLIAISLPFFSPGKRLFSFSFGIPLHVTDIGLMNFASVLIKAIFAISIMTILTATTRFRDLLAGMQRLKIPQIFVSLLGFMYRYIFLFTDETERMSLGRKSRSFGNKRTLSFKGFAWMISTLFVRSFERADRIYHAMCARGYVGSYRTLTEMNVSHKEYLYLFFITLIIISIKIIGRLYG